MNTLHDLEREFADLSTLASGYDAIRAEMAARVAGREKRRRTTALIAVAAAVVLVVGGIGVTRAMVSGGPGTARPAAPSGVVAVPDVPLPADTQLIRHQLQPVISPVTATPPQGLTGMTWMQAPGRLSVSYVNLSAAGTGVVAWTADSPGSRTAGYVVTDSATDHLSTFGAGGSEPAPATSKDVRVAGHSAWLDTAPDGAVDAMGLPAAQRISWKLADGRYIHVWDIGSQASGASPEAAVLDFAAGIADTPMTLPRALGLGATLPGLTVDSSMNMPVVGGLTPEYLMLCPAGVDPWTVSSGSASDSGASSPPTVSPSPAAEAVAGQPMSIEPAVPESSVSAPATTDNPAASCLTAGVVNVAESDLVGTTGMTDMTAAGRTVRVSPQHNSAMARLDTGATAFVAAPASVKLSAADLAALAASVRLSPDVRVLSVDSSAGQHSGATVTESGSSSTAVTNSSVTSEPASTLALPPGEASMAVSASGGPVVDDSPIDVDRGDVVAALSPDRTLATIEFSLQNTGGEAVTLTKLQLDVPGWSRPGLRARLDNTAAAAPFQEMVLPMVLAPRSRVRVQVTFHNDQCSVGTLSLAVEWEAGSSGGGSSGDLPITDPAGGLAELEQVACG